MAEWMAFNVDDYVSNTLHLTTRQHGAYILLICAAWKAKGLLPGTDAGLMAIAKLQPKEWKDDGPTLKAFLTRRGDAWVHERVEFEWKDAQSLIAAKSKAGKEGARKRWQGRANGKPDGSAMAEASQPQGQTDAPQPLPQPVTTTDTDAAKPATPSAAVAPPVAVPIVDDDLEIPERLDRRPKPDVKAAIFGPGLQWMQQHGCGAEAACRSFLGQLIRDHGEAQVAAVLIEAQRANPVEPKSWMKRNIGASHGQHPRNPSRVQPGGESATAVGVAAAFARRSVLAGG